MTSDEGEHNYRPEAGYVPDAETAMKIAEAVWLPIYGATVLEKKPWRARLENDVWVVEGSLPELMAGGVPVAKISKRTGEILRVSHGSSPSCQGTANTQVPQARQLPVPRTGRAGDTRRRGRKSPEQRTRTNTGFLWRSICHGEQQS
jgi:hypothetical protein